MFQPSRGNVPPEHNENWGQRVRDVHEIIVHCAATPEGRHVTVDTIRGWHKSQGWRDIGYHYVIYVDGTVHAGRPVEQVGAHVVGHNAGTIGITYVGGVAADGKTPKDRRTSAQKTALDRLLRDLVRRFPGVRRISGHRDYAAKACPSFDATTEYRNLVAEVRAEKGSK
ncbi:N-acetylmuramoyl-L-alanine amidase [Microvirga calopogonii]|uniref:N-acetylmuramoyl-L-alanine amidase n=1 Tax=Microvirga calopogonii TaxID=2078013 RepID=UPI00197C6717|nr:N-acetylmuramoyl-L-alanine amidase [Microvirga calopogonii]